MARRALKPPVGLFGGSFDPPHAGHWHVAETARQRLRLSKVFWCVARGNPLKSTPSDYTARLEKVAERIAGRFGHETTTIENDLGLTYAIDTITAMRATKLKTPFIWIMGGDSLSGFHHWRYWQAFAELIPIVVVSRPGETMSALNAPFARRYRDRRLDSRDRLLLPHLSAPRWVYLQAPFSFDSSTAIRHAAP